MIWAAAGMPLMVALTYWLWLHTRRHEPSAIEVPDAWPAIDVLVPTWDEADHLPRKLANLAALDYPANRLTVWVVDGGSRDGTAAIARACAPACRVLVSPQRGKAAQLNAGLREGTAPLVLVTDADSTLPRDALRALARAMAARPDLGAVGTSVVPAHAHPIERAHWAIQNRLRAAEARAGHGGLLVAPCYLFRRTLVDGWPADVVADDAFVAWEVARRGSAVGHVPVCAVEWRAPHTMAAFAHHKLRKTYAYTQELVRAAGARRSMPAIARAVLAWRIALSVSLPIGGLALAAGLLGSSAAALAALGVAAAVAASAGLARTPSVERAGVRGSAAWLPLVLAVLAVVSVAALALALVRRPPDPHRRVALAPGALPDPQS